MSTLVRPLLAVFAGALIAGCSGPASVGPGPSEGGVVSIEATASPAYGAAPEPRASPQPATYELRLIGSAGGGTQAQRGGMDPEEVARDLAEPLTAAHFHVAESSGTRMIIKVYWGTTVLAEDERPKADRESTAYLDRAAKASDDAEKQDLDWKAKTMLDIEAGQDRQTESRNADILGYTAELDSAPAGSERSEALLGEIRQRRFYLILRAVDPKADRAGAEVVLWETRLSITRQAIDTERLVSLMAYCAVPYLGRDSHGLAHVRLSEPGSRESLPRQ
jgi:hypothetical protein